MRQLDALRAVAVLTVLLEHWLPLGHPLRILSQWGTLGVTLFFVLSGFLITEILLRGRRDAEAGIATRAQVLKNFYIRRALRIFPVYYLAIALGCWLNLPHMRDAWWWHATYLSNFWVAQLPAGVHPGPAGIFWTLAVEEQFYLIWPLLVLFTPRRALFAVFVLAILSSPVFTVITLRAGYSGVSLMMPYALQYFALGGILALARQGQGPVSERAYRIGTLSTGLVALAVLLYVGKPDTHWGRWVVLIARPLTLSLVFGGMIAWCARGVGAPLRWPLEFAPVVYIGRISYGIYVYHLMVLYGVPAVLEAIGLWNVQVMILTLSFWLRLAATLAVASLSWHLFEAPISRLKHRFVLGNRGPRPEAHRPEQPAAGASGPVAAVPVP